LGPPGLEKQSKKIKEIKTAWCKYPGIFAASTRVRARARMGRNGKASNNWARLDPLAGAWQRRRVRFELPKRVNRLRRTLNPQALNEIARRIKMEEGDQPSAVGKDNK
jgi:hypothetical protein